MNSIPVDHVHEASVKFYSHGCADGCCFEMKGNVFDQIIRVFVQPLFHAFFSPPSSFTKDSIGLGTISAFTR